MSGETLNTDQSTDTDINLAAIITHRWSAWNMQKEPAMEKWEEVEAYKYATDTTTLPNYNSPFEHTTHIPVVAPIAQDLEAIINQVTIPHDDWFDFAPADRASAKATLRAKVKSFLKNRHRVGNFIPEVRKLISDLVTYGNAFCQVIFVDETNGQDKVGYIGPKINRISPYDIVFDATACSFAESPKIIRELITLGELKRRGDKGLLDQTVVNSILESRRASGGRRSFHDHHKDQQYIPAGFGTHEEYVTSGTIELLWFYGDLYDNESGELLLNKQIVVADDEFVLLNTEIDTVDGKPHIYKAGWENKPDNLWSMGPLDNIVGINYQVNHRENAKSDALDKLIVPDRVYQGDVEAIYDDETGATEYLAPEGGGVVELGINTQFFSFDLHIDRLEHEARRSARLPSDLIGFRSAGEKTLGEVTALTEGGMRGFIHKAQDFERFLEHVLTAELAVARDNLSSVIQVPGQAEGGVIPFLEISREDLKVSGSLIAQGARRFARKTQILGTLTQLSSTPMYQQAVPHVSGAKIAELLAELTETQEEGIFEAFASINEAAEAQILQAEAQQFVASKISQPTMDELDIDEQINGPEEELPVE